MRYQTKCKTYQNTTKGGFLLKLIFIIAVALGIASYFGYTPNVLKEKYFVPVAEPYVEKFNGVKAETDNFKVNVEERDARYQELINDIE
jgi:hypothetical protein